jgi:hypothetical protein
MADQDMSEQTNKSGFGPIHWHGLVSHTHPKEYDTLPFHTHDRYWFVPSDHARLNSSDPAGRLPEID